MPSTNATTYGSTIRTKHETDILRTAAGYLVANRFANNKMVGKGEGDTIRVNRILRPGLQITASTAGELYTDADAKALTSNFEEFSMEIWGDSFAFNDDIDITSYISDKDNQDTIARQMAQSLDRQIMEKICGIKGGMRYRTDATASTYQNASVQAGDTPSTTVFYGSGLAGVADDYYNGGFMTITNPSGINYDITRQITDYTSTGNVVTTNAFPQAHGESDSAQIGRGWFCVGTGLTGTASSVFQLLKIAGLHEHLQTEKYSGGVYHAFIPTAVHVDLQQDTTFVDSVVYDESFHLGTYRLGRIYDIEFLTTSQPYRESVAGVKDMAAGAVYVVPVFGMNAHSVFTFANPGGSGMFGTKFLYVDTPDVGNLRLSRRYISWKGTYAAGVTRATSMIGWMTAASDMEVLIN